MTQPNVPAQRALFVHAHPDDESLNNGATMAKYVTEGRGVTLVTCTAGEMGEVLVPELEHLAADREDRLGEHRKGEIEAAMKVLGVTDHRWLGGFGTYRDSGMQWHEDGYAIPADTTHDNAFWNTDLLKAASDLVEIIREVRPQVVVTYNDFGGYGHPDHIQAHRVTHYAVALAAVPSFRHDLGEAWQVSKVYWCAMSESRMRAAMRAMRAAGDTESFRGMDPEGPMPWFTPDADLSAMVDGSAFAEQKMDAMRAYPTQIKPDDGIFKAADHSGTGLSQEFYRLAAGTLGPLNADGLEDDLFAGL
ncbi:N-acetyl-1-D-myo-inositol-2-amino-2-deoxy-alpha-D-glucopyranoside deacetylase [Nocardioides nematodiphilus]|uniref:N-acetyl-1-D-myo-inositol-2-amino-2-deoxy-alpha- D-glucopyranoside deacetylase n=1 Tax=Nocardioides nematodiphilus TaxID=2849669 RepID=UPI001CD9C4DA|nr:N-acetyl-1-D-myo-inositol-2-amino-2-deoxy-alpha-D-glucopyranoside deacetylase [Nocardioides nematodiphilus]MCA1982869.1 N-acetyl-1-D-myo-inositol-2-amino-2-deoxy-alpha-D-glucopyranoside deacetylase [Nocardioides nematodiphilus]